MTALHGPLATSKGLDCLVRTPYGLAYKYVAEYEPHEGTRAYRNPSKNRPIPSPF